MQSRASKTIYWLGINNHIKNKRDTCQSCSFNTLCHSKEPLILAPPPNWTFEKICEDYFESKGYHYLTITDRFSAWICYTISPMVQLQATILLPNAECFS